MVDCKLKPWASPSREQCGRPSSALTKWEDSHFVEIVLWEASLSIDVVLFCICCLSLLALVVVGQTTENEFTYFSDLSEAYSPDLRDIWS